MKSFKVFFAGCLLFLSAFQSGDFTSLINQKLRDYVRNYPQEKIYIHFDREEYYAGEDLWFKVYLLNGLTHQKDSMSAVVYLDFIGDSSKTIFQKRIKITHGTGYGNYTLPVKIDFQVLTVKAYSSWMRNYTTDYFFEKKIKISGSKEFHGQPENDKFDFQFLPEGGYLVYGVDNKLAYKATSNSGMGIDFTGEISDGSQVVAKFKPEHAGMGFILFNPQPGKNYVAEVVFQDGSSQKFPIGKIRDDYLLQVDNSQIDFLNLNLVLSPGFRNSSETAWVAVQSGGRIFFMAQVKLSKPEIQIPIGKFSLPAGIVQCMLIDQYGRPKSERLAFIQKPAEHQLFIEADKEVYKPREETRVKLTLTNSAGDPATGDFSLSAFDMVQVDPAGKFHSTIYDYLMLSSELKGFIENPAYYFDPENADAAKALDILLMTQGWSRFQWEKILEDREPSYTHFMEQGFSITGRLLSQKGKVLNDGSISMLLDGDKSGFFTSIINEEGVFGFYDLDITDSTEIFMQAKDGKDRPYVTVELDTLYEQPEFIITDFFYPENSGINKPLEDLGFKRIQIREAFRLSSMDRVMDEVVIEGQRSKPRLAKKPNQLYPVPDNRIDIEDVPGVGAYTNIFHLLRGRVAGLSVSGDPQNPVLNIRGTGPNGSTSILNNVDPVILLDGFQTTVSIVASVPISDIETVDVIKGLWASVMYGGSGGMIAVYTKRGNTNEPRPLPGLTSFKMAGYSFNKEFYSPNYSEENNLAEPDYRATIHWEPRIKIDSTGSFNLNYFNSDLETDILIRVEGITDSGEPLAGHLQYILKK